MRKGASGWLAKGLLALLVASFAVWGIGSDMLNSSVGSNVIEVGDTTVSLGEFQRDYQRNILILSQRFKTQISPDQAKQFGLAQMTINQIASRALVDEKTRKLGLSANDAAVRDNIRQQPSFQNEVKTFDRYRFEDFLRRNGYSESEYVEIVRNDLTGQQLISTLPLAITTAPKIMLDTLYAFHGEKRTADFINIEDSSVGFAPAPTDDELTEFISKHPDQFSAPEYRKISYLVFTPENFVEDTPVSDDDLKAEYESRLSEFNIPAERAVEQMIFESEDKAKAALAKINAGSSFAEIGKAELELTPEDINLGLMAKQDLLPALQDPVFALKKDEVSNPIKTVLGWHLVKVTDIKPENTKSLDEVRDQLVRDIHLRQAGDIMYQQATKIEDEFAGGATITDAGKAIGVNVETTDWIDAAGMDKSGKPAANLPISDALLRAAFDKPKGNEPEISETDDGRYFAVVVNDIADAALKPLADVKTEATESWQADWRHQEAKKKADALLVKLNGGETLEDIAKSLDLKIQTSEPVRRGGPTNSLSQPARDGLFDLQTGAYGVNVDAAGIGTIIYRIGEIVPADPATDKAAVDQMSEQIAASVRAGILSQYESHLQREIGVSIKEDLIREYF
ncbi:SurA N-terminal domain-containing protein [Sneathiella sp.]|uniref:SurA N-terminal domain-containing protein n=1 Tax=Sneathiella sp. TaxID=1964365 RepID=UPI003565CEC1